MTADATKCRARGFSGPIVEFISTAAIASPLCFRAEPSEEQAHHQYPGVCLPRSVAAIPSSPGERVTAKELRGCASIEGVFLLPIHQTHLRHAEHAALLSKERKRPKITSALAFLNHYSGKYLSFYYTNLMQNDCIKANELALELADDKKDLQRDCLI